MLRTRPVHALVTLSLLAQTLAGCSASQQRPEAGGVPSDAHYTASTAAASDAEGEAAAAPAQYPMKSAEAKQEATAGAMAPPPAPPPPPGQMMPKIAATTTAGPPSLPAPIAVAPPEPTGTEDYKDYGVNKVVDPQKDRFSTFSIDVDTASYSISRRKLVEGTLPPFSAVRAEEYLNYFNYEYAAPTSGPFAVHFAAAPSPFTKGHHLVRVAVQGKKIPDSERKPVHLVYLVDTSGSMGSSDKLPLAQKSLKLLTNSLQKGDTVALCTYAGSVREVLAPTGIDKKDKIMSAIDQLASGGGTAMSSGIDLAYQLAEKTLVKGHVNRVIVLSDGDANVGQTSHDEILKKIRGYKAKGITLSTVGLGSGNYKDTMMERLADEGDGNYAYIDSEVQAKRIFQDQLSGMLEVIARDVKIQVEFDPKVVKEYRLIGYENRDIADKDFRNDKVDAGEIGNGHAVTAVYDVVLNDTKSSPLTLRLRHKPALGGDKATESEFKMAPSSIASSFDGASKDYRFAIAVAAFAEVLRQSPHARTWKLNEIARLADQAAATTPDQQEFVSLVHTADRISAGNPANAVAK